MKKINKIVLFRNLRKMIFLNDIIIIIDYFITLIFLDILKDINYRNKKIAPYLN